MNNNDIKQAFKKENISVRVRDLGMKFRICTVSGEAFDKSEVSRISSMLGLMDACGTLGGQRNQSHEWIGYKQDAFRAL